MLSSSSSSTESAEAPPQRLSDLLLGAQLVTRAQLEEAVAEQAKSGEFLCKILTQLKYITQDDINACFVKQCKIPHISLLDYDIGSDVLKLVPKATCEKYGMLPIDKLGRILTVAMVDPLDAEALEAVRAQCPELRIKPILCDWSHFEQAVRKYFVDSSPKSAEDTMSSFGLSKLPPKPAPKPAAPAPVLPAAASVAAALPPLDTGALVGAIQAGLRDMAQELAGRMAPAPGGLSGEALGSVLRDSIREAMAEAMKQQPAPGAPALSPEVLGAVMREAMRDAVAEALRQADRPAPSSAVAAVSAPADWSGFEQAFRATLEEFKVALRPAEAPAPAGAGVEGAIQELIGAIKSQTPTGEAMSEIIRESIGGAMQEAMASLVVQLRASSRPEESVPPFEQLAETIRDTIGGVMEEVLATLIVQLRAGSGPADQTAAQEAMIAALRDSQQGMAAAMREAIEAGRAAQEAQGARLAALAEAAVQSSQQASQLVEASLVQQERIHHLKQGQRGRHASVAPFGGAPAEGAATPEDEEVREALEAETPLETLTFDGFFAGKSNAFTLSVAQAVAAKPGGEYNPLFLYGNVGLGKTHLISATGNAIRANHPQHRVGYVSASHFSRRLKEALAAGAQDEFRDNYCHWDVLILDDIQFLGGRVEAQEEFFHIFNVLHQQGRQIIIASDKAPDRLGLLEQRLISRFSSGIVADLKPPEWETRMQILRRHAGEAGGRVPEEVLSLIAMRVPGDIRKMVGSLRKVAAFASMSREAVTVEMASEILSHLGGEEAA